jgi:hypothetical protein
MRATKTEGTCTHANILVQRLLLTPTELGLCGVSTARGRGRIGAFVERRINSNARHAPGNEDHANETNTEDDAARQTGAASVRLRQEVRARHVRAGVGRRGASLSCAGLGTEVRTNRAQTLHAMRRGMKET